MKIAIPVEEKSMEITVYQSFGRAPYFLIYNTITKEKEFLDNSAIISQGGAGIRASQIIADLGVRAIITPRCGENADKTCRNAEVVVYKCISGTVQQNIEAFINNELSALDETHPGLHGQR